MHGQVPGPEQLRLLSTLIKVCGQYMSASPTYLDHDCLSAGEHAVALLEEYGLIIPEGRGGFWTSRAQFLGDLRDFEDYEAIKSRYRALPEGEQFSPGRDTDPISRTSNWNI